MDQAEPHLGAAQTRRKQCNQVTSPAAAERKRKWES